MKNIFLSLLVISSLNSFSQIKNVNSYDELIKIQNSLNVESKIVVVWGKFGAWGKFGWDSYKYICPGVLNKSKYAGLMSALDFELFSDSTTNYYLPIAREAKINYDFNTGDIIKLKVRIYKNCKMHDGKIYFLIEELY